MSVNIALMLVTPICPKCGRAVEWIEYPQHVQAQVEVQCGVECG